MSLDDRDWYRDAMRERAGLKPKWQLWRKSVAIDDHHKPYYVKPSPSVGSWHPVLQILLFAVICLGTFLLLRLFSH